MCITRKERYRLITGRELPKLDEIHIEYQKTGPGEFDPLRSMDEKSDNWQTIQTLQVTPDKPKIIFCYPALSNSTLSQTEDSLFDGLCNDFDVYIWQGPKAFSEMRPVANDQILLQKMSTAYPDNEENILKVFEQQHLTTNNIYIWDYKNYIKVFRAAKALTGKNITFDLPTEINRVGDNNTRDVDLLDASLTRIFDKNTKVFSLFAPSVEEVLNVRQSFPYLESVILHKTSSSWINKNLHLFNQLNLTIAGDKYNPLTHLIISRQTHLKGLFLVTLDYLESIELQGAQIETIGINSCPKFQNLISSIPNHHLTLLSIRNAVCLTKLNLKNFINLKFLTATDCPGLKVSQLIFPIIPLLQNIALNTWASDGATLDLSMCKKLISVDLPKNFSYKLPAHIATLNETKTDIIPRRTKNFDEVYEMEIKNPFDLSLLLASHNCERVTLDLNTHLNDKMIGFPEKLILDKSPQIKIVNVKNVLCRDCDFSALKDIEEYIVDSITDEEIDKPECRSLKRIVYEFAEEGPLDISNFNYKYIEITGSHNQTILPLPNSNLHTLILKNVTLYDEIDFNHYPKLSKLILIDCKGINKASLPNGLQYLHLVNASLEKYNMPTGLKDFHFAGRAMQFAEMNFNLSNLNHLHSVFIYTQTSPAYPVVINCSHCPKLQELEIISPQNNVMLFTEHCESIKYLSISIYNGFKLMTASGLKDLPKLRNLNIIAGNIEQTNHLIPKAVYQHSVNLLLSTQKETKERKSIERESKLTLTNSDSPVTFFSSQYVDKIDAKTTAGTSYQADPKQYEFSGTVFSNTKKENRLYRINSFNGIFWIGDRIDFYITFNFKKINLPHQLLPQTISHIVNDIPTDTLFYYVEGLAKKGLPSPIISAQAIEKPDDILQVFIDPLNAADIVWDKDKQQCYAIAKTAQKVRIMLQVKENPDYEKENNTILGIVTSSPEKIFALPSKEAIAFLKQLYENDDTLQKLLKHSPKELLPLLRKKLAMVDKGVHPEFAELYKKLFQSSLSIDQKLQAIVNYCKDQFTEGELEAKEDQPLEVLIATIVLRKGACRHVSRAFWVLAGLIGVPVIMPRSEQHQFVEIPSRDQQGIHLRRIDLGGLHRADLTPPEVREELLQKIAPSTGIINDEKIRVSPQILLEEAKQNEYNEVLRKLITPYYLTDWKELINNTFILPPLIELEQDQDPLDCCGRIFQTFQKNKFAMNHFHTIHSAEEFKKFFEPLALVKGQWQRLPAGPLKETMQHKGVLVVNWSNFSATDIASYKSILDKPAMLYEYAFPLQVINIVKMGQVSCEAFRSRTQPCRVEQTLFVTTPEEKKALSLPKVTINLDHATTWRKKIYGKIKYQGKEKILTESKLIAAIKENRPIEIILNQPPKDNDFKIVKYRLEIEKKLFFNGSYLPVHPNSKITLQETTRQLIAPSNLILNTPDTKPHHPIYINANELHELKEQLIIDEKNEGISKPGLLAAATEKDIFYITQPILPEARAALYRYIEKLKKPVNIIDNSEIKIVNRLFVSNDPDYLAEQLATKHDAIIIDVTPETSFKSLIAEIEDSLDGFIYHEREMLKLLSSRNIILNGAISSDLYHQLLPLFNEPSQIRVNGKIYPVTGKLMLVQPKEASFIPKQSELHEYQFSDYRSKFLSDNKQDEYLICQIEKFYSYLSKLPHHGPGFPKIPTPSYHLLKQMLTELKNNQPAHKRNPIKAIFLYDYPKESEEYAFVNVIAKRLFTANDNSACRTYKINNIIQQFNIDSPGKIKPHLWRLLNCFNGVELHQFFKENDIVFSWELPTLSSSFLSDLFKKILPQSVEKKSDRSHKQMAEFERLLAEEGTDLIMLKGGTGVGKTEAVKRLLPEHSELHNIEQWLRGEKKYLLLDEANMKKPGTFDFLKGITRKNRLIYYSPTGKFYQIPSGNKVIMTANPENFPGRYWHDFFQTYVKTIYFKKPTDAEIKKTTLACIDNEDIQHHLLFVYHLFEKYNPFLMSSYRDIENLRDRFLTLLNGNPKETLFNACIGQYAGGIQDQEKRSEFINELTMRLGIKHIKKSYEVRKIGSVFITPQKEYLIDAIQQDLLMRDRFIKNQLESKALPPPSYKSAVVLEGEPGTGKSSLLRELAAKYDPITISGGSKKVSKLLIDAFHAGKIVILDEFNLDDPDLEILKNELLSGRYQGKLAKTPGFMILASQNASSLAGRKSQSPAEMNRTHFLYMDSFIHRERIQIATAAGIQCPKAFARAYQALSQKTPGLNMRTFFIALQQEISRQQSIKKVSIKPLSVNQALKEEKNPIHIWMNFFSQRLNHLQLTSPNSKESEALQADLKTLKALEAGEDITDYPKSEVLEDFLKQVAFARKAC